MPFEKIIDKMTWSEIVDRTLEETEEQDNKGFKEWMLTKEYLKGRFFDKFRWLHLYNIQKKLNSEDADFIEAVCGKERSGKSTIAKLSASIIDPTFNNDRFFNDALKLFNWLKLNKGKTKGKAIVIDEGILMLFSREAKSGSNISIVKLFALIGQCNLFVEICIPKYIVLDSYIKDERLHSLIQIVHKHSNFVCYNESGIKQINEALKKKVKFDSIKVKSGDFYYAHWTNETPCINDLTNQSYKKMKDDAWSEFLDEAISSISYGKLANTRKYLTIQELINETGMSYKGIWDLIKQKKIKAIQIGKKWLIEREMIGNNENSNVFDEKTAKKDGLEANS